MQLFSCRDVVLYIDKQPGLNGVLYGSHAQSLLTLDCDTSVYTTSAKYRRFVVASNHNIKLCYLDWSVGVRGG